MHISDLTDHTGYWLRMVSNAVSQDFARRVAVEGVTVAEWVFLRALFDAEATAPVLLARRMGMTRGAITKLADRLIAKRLVTRLEQSGRGQKLALTPEGRAKVPGLADLADRNDADYFGALPEADRAALDRILQQLVKARGLSLVPLA